MPFFTPPDTEGLNLSNIKLDPPVVAPPKFSIKLLIVVFEEPAILTPLIIAGLKVEVCKAEPAISTAPDISKTSLNVMIEEPVSLAPLVIEVS